MNNSSRKADILIVVYNSRQDRLQASYTISNMHSFGYWRNQWIYRFCFVFAAAESYYKYKLEKYVIYLYWIWMKAE